MNILLNKGVISRIEGLEKVQALGGVISILPMHKIGDKVELNGTVFQIFAKVSIVKKSKRDLLDLVEKIMEIVVVEDEEGRNMKLETIESKDVGLL